MNNPQALVESVVNLGRLILQFGRVERVTRHEDGVRPETDTDHTVMLGVVACAIARELYPELNLGLLAQYALVHDLVEAYAGDTMTIGINAEGKKEKDMRERQALEKIEQQFAKDFPWLTETLHAYESLGDPEARFIKTIDKMMPKITHILNGGAIYAQMNKMKEEVAELLTAQNDSLALAFGSEFPKLIELMRGMGDETLKCSFPM